MEHDIIAELYPLNGNELLQSVRANPRSLPPRRMRSTRGRHRRRERESTEPLENTGGSALDYLPYIVVRLGDVPRTSRGLVIGANPQCDVPLDDFPSLSNFHVSLTFDDYNRPIVEDLNSSGGTQVTYKGRGNGVRRGFRWIVGGHGIPQRLGNIIVTLAEIVTFQIVVYTHDIESPTYVEGVRKFKQGTATAASLLDDLGLSLPPTRGAKTPGFGEIKLRKTLGEGSFGIVTHLWDVSTGEEHVVKRPSERAIRRGQVDRAAWEKEAHIMGLVEHVNLLPLCLLFLLTASKPHIVRLIEFFLTPQPELHLEYMPFGSLDGLKRVTYAETSTIIQQCSSALAYLHELEPPIAHRDIKPANILVEHRSEDRISVKLGDFGLSRNGAELSTLCGTAVYLAPEVHSDVQRRARHKTTKGYTAAVDIWSLGVVAMKLIYDLPTYTARYDGDGVAWCKLIVSELRKNDQRQPTTLGSLLMNGMVIRSPELRYSARDCCELLADSFNAGDGSAGASSATPYSEIEDQSTMRYALQNESPDNLSTVVYQPRSAGTVTSSYIVRSGAPPPSSHPSSSSTPQEYEDSEVMSSSAMRQYANVTSGHELDHFQQEYSTDPFNPLYVGSSLASELGGDDSEAWASDFLRDSTQQDETVAPDCKTSKGSGGNRVGHAGDSHEYHEMAEAAYLLQALGQDPEVACGS